MHGSLPQELTIRGKWITGYVMNGTVGLVNLVTTMMAGRPVIMTGRRRWPNLHAWVWVVLVCRPRYESFRSWKDGFQDCFVSRLHVRVHRPQLSCRQMQCPGSHDKQGTIQSQAPMRSSITHTNIGKVQGLQGKIMDYVCSIDIRPKDFWPCRVCRFCFLNASE
jgi:hypothetical protein